MLYFDISASSRIGAQRKSGILTDIKVNKNAVTRHNQFSFTSHIFKTLKIAFCDGDFQNTANRITVYN